jgi:hypothetical protein
VLQLRAKVAEKINKNNQKIQVCSPEWAKQNNCITLRRIKHDIFKNEVQALIIEMIRGILSLLSCLGKVKQLYYFKRV